MEKDCLLKIQHLSFSYSAHEIALENINVTVNKNDFLVIVGPNGGGKSTLLKLILGLLKPSKGKITFCGSLKFDKGDIGYVPQISTFDKEFPIKVKDLVVMGLLGKKGLKRFYSKNDYKSAEEALDFVKMKEFKEASINELSGGQLQRVMISRSLVTKPQLLLLDEPHSFIDTEGQDTLTELLSQSHKKMTIILVTHDMGIVSSSAQQIACINKKLFYHGGKELPYDILEEAYGCPIDLIAHGVPHRVLKKHEKF